MASTFYIKRNDTAPVIQQTLLDSSGNAVDLTGASVAFSLFDVNGKAPTAILSEAAATVVQTGSAPNFTNKGVVKYAWQAGDTAHTPGIYLAEWEVTFGDGTIETFPDNDFIYVYITADLANA